MVAGGLGDRPGITEQHEPGQESPSVRMVATARYLPWEVGREVRRASRPTSAPDPLERRSQTMCQHVSTYHRTRHGNVFEVCYNCHARRLQDADGEGYSAWVDGELDDDAVSPPSAGPDTWQAILSQPGTRPIPQHRTPSGAWCRFSGMDSLSGTCRMCEGLSPYDKPEPARTGLPA